MSYEVLSHTGDVKIRVSAENKKQLFADAAKGMFAVLRPTTYGKQPTTRRKVHMTAPDVNALLVEFLNELNYLRQVKGEAYESITMREFSDTELEAELAGKRVEGFAEDIKAATFHDVNIRQNAAEEWETSIVFDV